MSIRRSTMVLTSISLMTCLVPELGAAPLEDGRGNNHVQICSNGIWSDDEWCIEPIQQLPDVDGDPYAFRLTVGPMANTNDDLAFSRLFAPGSGLKWGSNGGLVGTFNWAGGSGFNDLEAANLSKDGWGDLITVNGQAVDIRYGAAWGHINFSKVYNIPLGFAPTEIEVADLDLDGDSDFVALTANGDLFSARYYLPPFFPAFSTLDTGLDADLFTLGDMDGDNRPELIKILASPQGTVGILAYHNIGSGQFANDVVLMAKFHYFNEPVSLIDVKSADFDNDGFADVAVATSKGLLVSKSSDDVISPPLLYGGYNTVESMTAADLNSDGRDDLILASSDGKLRWLRSKPNGTFDVAVAQTVPREFIITDIEAGDFNNDGWLDIVYTDVFHIYELLSNP